ncbi:hypothetical protein JCM17845_21000 [Iodidimonas gelatinilytica]|uniref:Uncharacterized protein n=1 Tax=Iodidimonas gelatinilytica TaxID=1236966 RepID=A0A5A7N0D1_9PROT|nr:hypothetical protein JCM17845_21000 [Iodidimonas gelatinilytica]
MQGAQALAAAYNNGLYDLPCCMKIRSLVSLTDHMDPASVLLAKGFERSMVPWCNN